MPLLLGQLVYTSFPGVGFRALASAQVPTEIQQAFIQQVVYQYWDSYNPPKSGYRAAYLHQVTLEHSLFGWLYNDGLDDLGRSHVPYFVCYYLAELVHPVQLENIFTCLHRGPIALIDRESFPDTLETIVVPNLSSYQPARIGVAIPSGVRECSHVALKHKTLLDVFIPVDEAKTPALSETVRSLGKSRSQMTKIALLIGVSDYGPGLKELPRALQDVQAMQQILQHPEIGSFAEVKTLLNPDRQAMEEAIESVFSERQPDDLVLLYFSGHGLTDDSGKLYLATSITRLNVQEKLVKSSAVLASFVQEIMSESRSLHQVVIFECGFGVDVVNQIGGEGRVILTSSTSTHCNCEHSSSSLSGYTHYLVEGMETGAADLDNDGVISILELHEYTSRKVQTAMPAMQPAIYGRSDYYQLIIAKAAMDEKQRKYRVEAERCASYGEISIVSRSILDVLRDTLGLLPEEAAAIEAEVLEPYNEYHKKLQRYVQEYVSAIQQSDYISDETRKRCKHLQQVLGLRDEDVAPIEAQIAGKIKAIQSPDKVGAHQIQSSEQLTPVKAPVKALNDVAARQESEPAPPETSLPVVINSTWTLSSSDSANSVHPHLVPTDTNSWLIIGTGTAMSFTAVMGVLYAAYIQLNEIRTLKTEAKYEECITKAELDSWAAKTVFHKDAQGLLNECWLEQAKRLALGEKFSAAIKAAENIPKNSLLYPEAQKLIKEWSEI